MARRPRYGRDAHYKYATYQATNARTEARRRGYIARITLDEWRYTLEFFEYTCAYCGVSCETRPLQLEHFVPLGRGGHSVLGNCVPACSSCNYRKSTNDPFHDQFWAHYFPRGQQQRVYELIEYAGGLPEPGRWEPKHAENSCYPLTAYCGARDNISGSDLSITCDKCRSVLFGKGWIPYV
ncbi:hypothetical protein LCGC14_1281350 [marine sediment metagenome]|uniref:HNH nuclease domain-containing protein n=1 Tax=marine sediment metagenome TaxID=412755 RepID=A0A0F9KV22_9ZZZZ